MKSLSPTFDPIQLRPTVMEVNLDALAHNFRLIAERVKPALVMPVVKSNAYGHGMLECAATLEREGASVLGVALLEEGIQLRLGGIKTRILVLGGIFTDQLQHFLEYDLEILASSVYKLKGINRVAQAVGKIARVHLDFDTGMERIGVHYYNAETLLEAALGCEHCQVVGVSTHFAGQESEDPTLTALQLERFLSVVSFYKKRGLPMPARHAAASGAILSYPETHLEMVRPGLMLYGVVPAPHLKGKWPLRPVMSLRSKVVYFKVVQAGAGVSYGHEWTATVDTRVVTVPVGYGDGYLRGLSNRGEVLIQGKRYPVVGVVCMDQMMIDIGPEGVAYNGDEVVLLGEQGAETITLEDLCSRVTPNPREFLVSTNLRIPRQFVGGS